MLRNLFTSCFFEALINANETINFPQLLNPFMLNSFNVNQI